MSPSPSPACFHLLAWSYVVIWLMATVMSQSVIESLPGFPGKLPFKLETGYIGVGESEEVQMFYYFVESEKSPQNDPLFLWLTGGPGCSGLSALFYEIGPIQIDYANSTGTIPALRLNPYSWTKVANIIFLDQPVGTGFSYAKTAQGYKCSSTLSAKQTYHFLIKWLINNPKYLKNPLYIAGGSYSGITVPLVVDEMYNGIEGGSQPPLNIKGYILGNPFTDMYGKLGEYNGRIGYAHRMGLLSDELYMSAKENCNGDYLNVDPDNDSCNEDLQRVTQCLEKIYIFHILEPQCGSLLLHMPPYARRFLQSAAAPLLIESWCRAIARGWGLPVRRRPVYVCRLLHGAELTQYGLQAIARGRGLPSAQTSCVCLQAITRGRIYPVRTTSTTMIYSKKWANSELVQKALHIREGTIIEWARCNETIKENVFIYDVNSTVDYHKKFTHKHCRALIFSGDHDMAAPHTATEEWIKSLKIEIGSKWRPWFVEAEIAGYTTAYFHNKYELTYATVKGAGHTPAEYKPMQSYAMIERWLNRNPL